jgi:hypothetical protein
MTTAVLWILALVERAGDQPQTRGASKTSQTLGERPRNLDGELVGRIGMLVKEASDGSQMQLGQDN